MSSDDCYSKLGAKGVTLRRQNKERLAKLEATGKARRTRIAKATSRSKVADPVDKGDTGDN